MKASHLASALALPVAVLGRVGDRCSGSWGSTSCICLDKGVCTGTYGGVTIQGYAGNWPCPSDGANVWGCQVPHCPNQDPATFCTWKDLCGVPYGGPTCPGGSDYICCLV